MSILFTYFTKPTNTRNACARGKNEDIQKKTDDKETRRRAESEGWKKPQEEEGKRSVLKPNQKRKGVGGRGKGRGEGRKEEARSLWGRGG